ncbi:MAG: futalosine hydrolase [Bacteroidales bacterium]|nr:futalosine hydrolase [Bacteroidales bacterium]
MSVKILFVAATQVEAEVIKEIHGLRAIPGGYLLDNLEISLLVAGVGSVSTAWEMQRWISVNDKPDLAINTGIAGSYNKNIKIGDVVMPLTECFGDAGIEDGDNFLTLFEAGLIKPSQFPFINGLIQTDPYYAGILSGIVKPATGITVNTATGSDTTREKFVLKFNPDIETMEGATFFYICSKEKIPFFALRAVSNIVETRNRNNWDIKLALSNLAEKLNEVVLKLK